MGVCVCVCGRGGGGVDGPPCRMSNLRKPHVALSNLRNLTAPRRI